MYQTILIGFFVFVVLLSILAFAVGVVFAVLKDKKKQRDARSGSITSLSYGVELIFGLMGSGKSFFAVRRLVEEVLESRRPVYTNLPLKFKVVRAYLKIRGGPEVANLIRRLDERHWRAFLARQHAFATFREQRSKKSPADLSPAELADFCRVNSIEPETALTWPKFYDRSLVAWFNSIHGEPILEGPSANWIPPTSLIVLDEVQHWHPMTKQSKDESREDLLAYLTMIRHHLHMLWIITQDPSRVAIEFRLLARFFWRVWDPSETRLVGPVRFKHVGLKAMAYECMTREQMDNFEKDKNDRPVEKFYIWPGGTGAKVVFRLYSSHTNIGSARAMMRELRRTRQAAGLDEDGHTQTEKETPVEQPSAKKPSILRRLLRLIRKVCTLVIVGFIGYGIASANAPEPVPVVVDDPAEPVPVVWPAWTATGSAPFIDGARVRPGDAISDRITLDYVHPDRRKLVLRVDDAEWWLWEWPNPEPIRVGTVEDIRSSVERLSREQRGSYGPAVPGSPSDP